MLISILTLFPEIFPPTFNSSILGRAQKKGLVKIKLVNIRDFGLGKYHQVDDKPYGGGVGMIMRVDVLERAITSSRFKVLGSKLTERVISLDPKGKLFDQSIAKRYSKLDHLILVCGHYEGIDERVSHFIDEKISIGNYILTGGEIPAMMITDAVARLIPDVLSKKDATIYESFSKGKLLEEPHYTRPPEFQGLKVPKILLSGNHRKIEEWRESKRKLLK